MTTIFETVWADRRIAALIVILISSFAAVLSAWSMPRGPLTSTHALLFMAIGLLLGFAAGLASGRGWAAFLAGAAFIVVYELARFNVQGPTVDLINLSSVYGIIALITGRLVYWLLVLVPLVPGSALGAALAGRLSEYLSVKMGIMGWSFSALAGMAIIALAIVIAGPATTHPIVGSDGGSVPGSVAELTRVEIGGVEQTIMIRGRDENNPVLLYLAGGPGGTDLGAMRADTSLEEDFVVVTWDQRGTGKSYAAIEPIDRMTLDQMVSDTIEITNYLRERFNEEKIYLVGNSWGTILGALAVQQNPELYHAYVGTGQMVSPRETDIMFYEDTLAWAQQTGQDNLVETLEQNGPPPYADLLDYEPIINHEHDWNPYPGMENSVEMPFNTFVPENTFMDRVNALRGLLDTYSQLYPQIQEVDFRDDVVELEVPFYMVTGAYEARGRRVLSNEWFDRLSTPSKELIVFDESGHRPSFEQPAEFAALMRRVLSETQAGG